MPRKTRIIAKNSTEQEGRILLAISALKNKEISSVQRAAEIFDIPQSTLRDRLNGRQYQIEKRANSHRLSTTQEESLIEWILSRDQHGVPPRPSHVQEMANILLQADNPSGFKPISKNWVSIFTNRRDEIKTRYAQRYNYSRAQCEDPKIIKGWFDCLQQIQIQYSISHEDIYNFDETGFTIGLIATTKVVTRANIPGKPHLIQPGNREWVTIIKYINTTG
jgi:predicted HTH domain antitoxin